MRKRSLIVGLSASALAMIADRENGENVLVIEKPQNPLSIEPAYCVERVRTPKTKDWEQRSRKRRRP